MNLIPIGCRIYDGAYCEYEMKLLWYFLIAVALLVLSDGAHAIGKFTCYGVDASGSRMVAMDEEGAVI